MDLRISLKVWNNEYLNDEQVMSSNNVIDFFIFEVLGSILGWDACSFEVSLVFLRVSRKMQGYYTFPVYCSLISL